MIHVTPLLVITLTILVGLFIGLAFLVLRPQGACDARHRATPMLAIAALFPAGMFCIILACIAVAMWA
ncbi:MAG: hypothetical protein EPN72_09395 [Nevskiaceae bacterium]|nr:MAG: hypothetical protein EPN63_08735 [Nevskiaceae bacterium]TBR72648.1 MAG: hypothetical protein EPN72_09395 [Nevskiaceae bacterium]